MYCSGASVDHLRHNDILSYEEIAQISRVAAELGVSHIRLTGGEPLVRPGLSNLIELLTAIPGIEDISLTTNGTLLKTQAAGLKQAGLRRINISLDSLKSDRFEFITGGRKLDDVLAGIEQAHVVGLSPVKINVVVMPGLNDDEIVGFAAKARDEDWHVRFIEYMPFDGASTYDTITVAEIKARIETELGSLWACCISGAGPANYFSFGSGHGTVGFIRPISHNFCSECNRLRLTADGKLRPCLLDESEIEIRDVIRQRGGARDIRELLLKAIDSKPERHNLMEAAVNGRQMKQIGG
jgi:cyclic pyranopterin phosphate synthase